ncbi:MAG: putative DNA binding domain-containing protein [Clostridiales Family XIII bacterium]|jgi:ATP-dependent DNA helicase RecG|nr:putative DNA binding domain-containing protein [Clostridiales Family XIII bacterium]
MLIQYADNINTVEELLEAPEGEHYEFKEAKTRYDFDKLVKYACALSNSGGGKIVLGVTDKRPRQVVGSQAFTQPERTRKGLIERLHIRIDFQSYKYEGKRVLVFEVASRPIGFPIQAGGIAWWRDGDDLVPMPEHIKHKIYEESGHDFSADICEDATIADLDDEAIEIFRERWIEKTGNSRLKNLSTEQLLRDCEAITDAGTTYAALILFGKRASLGRFLGQSEIIFEYRSKEAAGPAQQREEFRVGFFASFDKLWDLINLRNDKQHYQEGFFVFDIPTFNERVCREAILNAASHRNYQYGGSIFIRQYPDRLEIDSPGGLPADITPDNILNRQLPRNRRIAGILSLCGLIERAGQGMDLIYELSIKDAKALPDFDRTDAYNVVITLNGTVIDDRLIKVFKEIGDEKLEYFTVEDFLVVNSLFYDQKIPKALRSRAKRLIDIGVIERVDRNRMVLARSIYEATGQAGVHTRLVGLDRNQNKELILNHIKNSGEHGAPLRELQQVLPSHSKRQIQLLAQELRGEGRIYTSGKASGSRWYSADI